MRLSLVIPVYNEEQYIAQCLDCIMAQTVRPDEILVVDNNSTDASVAIIRRYPVRLVREPVQGMIPARNRGFAQAKYDIIARIDADTRIPPDWIAKVTAHFQRYPTHVGLTGPLVYYDVPWIPVVASRVYLNILKGLNRGKESFIGSNMVITKRMWRTIEPLVCSDEKKVHEDIDMAIHVARVGGVIGRDDTWVAPASGRRMQKAGIFWGEYPWRIVQTFLKHA